MNLPLRYVKLSYHDACVLHFSNYSVVVGCSARRVSWFNYWRNRTAVGDGLSQLVCNYSRYKQVLRDLFRPAGKVQHGIPIKYHCFFPFTFQFIVHKSPQLSTIWRCIWNNREHYFSTCTVHLVLFCTMTFWCSYKVVQIWPGLICM